MTTWDDFGAFALTALLLWAAGAVAAALRRRAALAAVLTAAGICVYAAFIAAFWAGLQRPPLRTIGEMDEGALLSAIAEGRGTAPLGELLAFDRRRRM